MNATAETLFTAGSFIMGAILLAIIVSVYMMDRKLHGRKINRELQHIKNSKD